MNIMHKITNLNEASSIIQKAKKIISLTGAGISVESGISPFRGKGGLWEKYDPNEYAHINTFKQNPEKSWIMLKDMGIQIFNAKPNKAHKALTTLQKIGKLDSIITQNVDNLHQEAGNKNVIEYHGNYKKLKCLKCGNEYDFNKDRINRIPPPPRCACEAFLKPNVVLFGESIPFPALWNAENAVASCDVLLVIGTSNVIYPAAHLPYIATKKQAKIIEINIEPTYLTETLTNIFLQGNAGEILQQIIKNIQNKK
jgi:NAD-dependent deacetylase